MAENLKAFVKLTRKLANYLAGRPESAIDKGASGSHRDNNWRKGAAQAKLKDAKPIGPGKNLNELKGGNFY